MKPSILIREASQNNLKSLNINLPLYQITAVTGVSGSGKSSLAFDTLYAEGQRRYVESFSAYARQFLERMNKPEVKKIEGIPPSIAINQNNPIKTSRSTLGTLTEINDYMKLFFARAATLYCKECNRKVERATPDAIASALLQNYDSCFCVITFPLFFSASPCVSPAEIEEGLRRQGFFRIYHENSIMELSAEHLLPQPPDVLHFVVDRLKINAANARRIVDSLELASKFGKGIINIFFPQTDNLSKSQLQKFSTSLHCAQCNISYKDPLPNLFSFNSPLGACEKCRGFGKTIEIDLGAVIPDQSLSLKENAIKPWATPSYREAYYDVLDFCRRKKIPTDVAFKRLSSHEQHSIIYGDDDFYGVMGFFNWLETKSYKMHIRVLLSKYRRYATCPACKGSRFKPEALLYKIHGKTISDIYAMSISTCHGFFEMLAPEYTHDKALTILVKEIQARLSYLRKVGLGYLTLDRQSKTLSGGEVERATLTTAIGSSLVNTLYVLDEPSIGLHPRDSHRLIAVLKRLRDAGNTIVIVEHDPDIILQSDTIIDLGPGAGEHGGHVVFFGRPSAMMKSRASLTGKYLSGAEGIPIPEQRRRPKRNACIKIKGASHHNLKNFSVTIPLGLFICITGVSGSGKSTLLENIIYHGLQKVMGKRVQETVAISSIHGAENIDQVVLMDQSPIGKTPRSNPATYIKVFDAIRALFAQTQLAQDRGYTPSMFSFNVKGGRCEHCMGEGFEKVEMQFLADVYVPCLTCGGKRYMPEILEIAYHGKNIHEVLQMTVSEARCFFSGEEKIAEPLSLLEMAGLGYLRLGQPVHTLSGGESQRLKLVSSIREGKTARTLFLFDEPTTGLHIDDIKKLLDVFEFLLRRGNSIIVVEHNMELVKCADHIIDLGPEGGDEGGRITAQGTPEHIIRSSNSHTGKFLKQYLYRANARAKVTDSHAKPLVQTEDIPNNVAEEEKNCIVIDGAREHNLKDIYVRIPREKVVAITGLSGSGKSTLAYDIIFAEGQRRFLETLSPYIRQYITQLQRPEVNSIKGIPPSIAIDQGFSQAGRKSTVATVTEIYHYIRLLYAKIADQHCPRCGTPVSSQTEREITGDILDAFSGGKIKLLVPLIKSRKGLHKGVIEKAKRDGYTHIRINGQIVDVKEIFAVNRYQEHRIEAVTAVLCPSKNRLSHLAREVKKALAAGGGILYVLSPDNAEKLYSTRRYCLSCEIGFEEPDPRLFSFNTKHGACEVCSGSGVLKMLSPELLAPNRSKSIAEGAIIPLSSSLMSGYHKRRILQWVENELQIPMDTPLSKLSSRDINCLFYGDKKGRGKAARGLIQMLYETSQSEGKNGWAKYLSQFLSEMPCPDCSGTRINQLARSFTIENKSIADVVNMTPDAMICFLSHLSFAEGQRNIAAPIIKELLVRLSFLKNAGLSYLTLNRSCNSLSRGEAQRVRLAAQMGSNLRGVAYILDEPTIGLHPYDNMRLLGIIRKLQKKGNSVIIVEHDEQTIKSADFIIDLGIGGGMHGGKVVASGTPEQIMQCRQSITGRYLARKNGAGPIKEARPLDNCALVRVMGAREHNLKNIDVEFPLNRMTVVTGVSGSGKSTLVKETLYNGIKRMLGTFYGRVGAHKVIEGAEQLKRAVEIDQSPIGKTPRSVPATYVGFYDEIRRLFSLIPDARIRGFSPGRFSFNIHGGRCEHCRGQGKIKVEMNFLPDVYVDCAICQGSRFNHETLQINLKDRNISQVLSMTVEEGCEFFKDFPSVYRGLKILDNIGLGYLTLGQPSPTLSGGEAQRLKIAYELFRQSHGNTLYILDEPTTGLHMADIEKLMAVLQGLVDLGNTVVIIEHNMEVITQADYIIDLGPGGGKDGGMVVASGTPEKLLAFSKQSYTARYLKKYLQQ